MTVDHFPIIFDNMAIEGYLYQRMILGLPYITNEFFHWSLRTCLIPEIVTFLYF